MHFFSKLELSAADVRFLVEEDVPSIRADVRLRSGDMIEFNGIHPRRRSLEQDTEERDAELLIVGRQVEAGARPAIVAGDLNDVAWSHTTQLFQRISGMIDPRRGRGMFSTFHARYPMLRWPLDHVLHENTFTLVRLQRLRNIGCGSLPGLRRVKVRADGRGEAAKRRGKTQKTPKRRESGSPRAGGRERGCCSLATQDKRRFWPGDQIHQSAQ